MELNEVVNPEEVVEAITEEVDVGKVATSGHFAKSFFTFGAGILVGALIANYVVAPALKRFRKDGGHNPIISVRHWKTVKEDDSEYVEND